LNNNCLIFRQPWGFTHSCSIYTFLLSLLSLLLHLLPHCIHHDPAQSSEEDYNYDGLRDVLHLTLTFPVEQSSPVCSVKALLFFDVALSVSTTLHNTCLVTETLFFHCCVALCNILIYYVRELRS